MKICLKMFIPLFFANTIVFLSSAQAGVAVVVSPDNETNSISKNEVARLFLKKSKKFSSGEKAEPLDLDENNITREYFYSKIVGKESNQLSAYWSRMIFTGKGTPPRDMGSDENVINAVSNNISAIGYIDTGLIDSRVKVLLTIN